MKLGFWVGELNVFKFKLDRPIRVSGFSCQISLNFWGQVLPDTRNYFITAEQRELVELDLLLVDFEI